MVAMEGEEKTAPKLLNGTGFNDLSDSAFFNHLEGPHTQISRSSHSLTLNISKMAADTAIFTMEGVSDVQNTPKNYFENTK